MNLKFILATGCADSPRVPEVVGCWSWVTASRASWAQAPWKGKGQSQGQSKGTWQTQGETRPQGQVESESQGQTPSSGCFVKGLSEAQG